MRIPQKYKKYILLYAIGIIFVGVAVNVFAFPPRSTIIQSNVVAFFESTVTAPDGWYMHEISKTNLLLTKQRDLPKIENTEGFAYGEQIAIEAMPLDGSAEQWATRYVPDDVLVLSKQWNTLNGHKILKVEHEVEAAGKSLTYYVFSTKYVYRFSLYPLEKYSQASSSYSRNISGVDTLNMVLSSFAKRL
ncbi:MAG: hypothetical protein ACYC1Y_02540 [Minisyncoccota bacterium]